MLADAGAAEASRGLFRAGRKLAISPPDVTALLRALVTGRQLRVHEQKVAAVRTFGHIGGDSVKPTLSCAQGSCVAPRRAIHVLKKESL
jgi:hypothetical protein